MSFKERFFSIFALALISIFLILDLFSDWGQGAKWWHIGFEALMALLALAGVIVLLQNSIKLRANLEGTKYELGETKNAVNIWRQKAQIHIDGLSLAIQAQFKEWDLSTSEREIALLLLKGLSLREISNIRNTTEKTVRGQAAMIYQKSGLGGRADLSAFFLEDMLS